MDLSQHGLDDSLIAIIRVNAHFSNTTNGISLCVDHDLLIMDSDMPDEKTGIGMDKPTMPGAISKVASIKKNAILWTNKTDRQ